MSAILQNSVKILSRSEARYYARLHQWAGATDPLRFIWQVINSRPATDDAQPSIWLVPSGSEPGRFYRVDIEVRLCSCDGFHFRHHCGHLRVADRAAELRSQIPSLTDHHGLCDHRSLTDYPCTHCNGRKNCTGCKICTGSTTSLAAQSGAANQSGLASQAEVKMDFAEETIRAGWREWAALAWAGLLDSGPGALFIDLAFDEQLQVRADAQYFSQAAMVRPACERLFISPVFTLDFFALSLAVASYDPLREVVFLIREPDFNSRILTRALAPSPGEAFIDQIGQRPANVAKATLTN